MASIDHLRSGQPLNTHINNQNESQSASIATDSSKEVQKPRNDVFSMSDGSRAISAMHQQITNEGYLDNAKIDAIKATITNGSYKVDADRLAANIMKHEDELRSFK
ncbi:flagellar biosynthesis anti-sigma factor FlgM [Candidatus Enterovibrio altilux]|uniref:Negative regulator of flagellin synthesis n=1 Tax=Candidatus Enterovibrio altilux TaxID=1927128 RepID=A0A291B763_9GAMM|nr:flagellar biosynthesis anti-sigma factor FlgM [Candidatus Enterovibrio luxaltus]ATF08816.1 Negative regulator of flagellin synthesis FlgM [Candidatus Enterovibrio luxaltus]